MGSSPSKKKKLNDEQTTGGNSVDSGQPVTNKTVRKTDATSERHESNKQKVDNYNVTDNGVTQVTANDNATDNAREKKQDQNKAFVRASNVNDISENINDDKDDKELPTNPISEAEGIKTDSGMDRNVLNNTVTENINTSPKAELVDIEDVGEELSEQIQANYNRRIPTLKWEDIVPNCYKMDHPRRGKAIVINNENFLTNAKRKGTFIDYSRICLRLRKLQFDVTGYIDVTCEEITSAFRQLADEDHSESDCFACVILSHGEPDSIYGIDGIMKLETIFKMFHADKCPTLAGKPKLFFIQACRGVEYDDGADVSVDVTDAEGSFSFPEEQMEYRVPDEADFLISYSTTEGYYSWRNAKKGTWYIQSLVHVLDQHGTVLEIQKLLTRVNKLVSQNFKSSDPVFKNKKQMPSFTSKLTKDLYFVPK